MDFEILRYRVLDGSSQKKDTLLHVSFEVTILVPVETLLESLLQPPTGVYFQ